MGVRFDSTLRVVLIPSRKDYDVSHLSEALWWNEGTLSCLLFRLFYSIALCWIVLDWIGLDCTGLYRIVLLCLLLYSCTRSFSNSWILQWSFSYSMSCITTLFTNSFIGFMNCFYYLSKTWFSMIYYYWI